MSVEKKGGRPEKEQKPHIFPIETGLNAYPVEPRIETEGIYGPELRPPTVEVAQENLNKILKSIQEQGGKLIGVTEFEVARPSPTDGHKLPQTEQQHFLIVEKKKKLRTVFSRNKKL